MHSSLPRLVAALFLAAGFFIFKAHAESAPPKGFLEQTDLFDVADGKYKSYRIPCLLALPDGTVLAFTSARKAVSDWADIDIMLRRSTDGGKTWEEAKAVANGGSKPADNPVAIWDGEEKAVHFLHQTNYEKVWYQRSDDGGKTFSEKVDITPQLASLKEKYPWTVIAPGPAHGIQLKNGRLVVPVWLASSKSHRPSVVTTIYSDDHGKTWHAGEIVPDTLKNLNETVAVEEGDSGVALYLRNEDPAYQHAISYSKDGATGWTKPALQPELYNPICFSSVLRLSGAPDKSRILFANPDSHAKTETIRNWGARPRENLTFKMSYDDGKTWPVSKVLEPGRAGYSDLAVLPDGTVLCLYERGFMADNNLNTKLLTIARFNLDWLTDGKDSLTKGKTE